jgi:hypothetical protein
MSVLTRDRDGMTVDCLFIAGAGLPKKKVIILVITNRSGPDAEKNIFVSRVTGKVRALMYSRTNAGFSKKLIEIYQL